MTEPRQLRVLAGGRAWARGAAQHYACERMLWLGEPPPGVPGGPAREAHKWLGRELDLLVIDAWAGFDVEAFGAASGALRGGGLLLLLTPPLAEWPHYADPEYARITVHPFRPDEVSGRFLARLVRLIGAENIPVFGAGDPLPPWRPPEPLERPADWCTADQQAALAALLRMARGEEARPMVLTSDRGRGKSAVLGMAAARLLESGASRILVTAPRLDAAEAVFAHAARLLPQGEVSRGCIRFSLGPDFSPTSARASGTAVGLKSGPLRHSLQFIAPDELVHALPHADLLLVDEAAAIPSPMLERLLAYYPRIVFATTLHGYEGTGRGFAVRFQQVLEQRAPGWSALRLTEPVRWAQDDALERFVFRALLLDAAAADDVAVREAAAADCGIERVERDALLADEATLRQLFGLLVLAHYRTSPLDLRHLLDGPNVSVWLMRRQGQVVATALTVREGGFDAALAQEIYQGRRRPRGHLIPQSLALHSGYVEAPRLRCERVMRIAVHPATQQRGLGTQLLYALIEQARRDGLDFIGSSFGATAPLLEFWRRAQLLPVRLGLAREASSGTHSVIVLKPLSAPGTALFDAVHARFLAHLPALLSDGMEEVDADVAAALLAEAVADDSLELGAQDRRDVESFVRGWRGYEVCQVALRKLVANVPETASLSAAQRDLLHGKIMRRQSWERIVAAFGYSGRAQALAALRVAVAVIADVR